MKRLFGGKSSSKEQGEKCGEGGSAPPPPGYQGGYSSSPPGYQDAPPGAMGAPPPPEYGAGGTQGGGVYGAPPPYTQSPGAVGATNILPPPEFQSYEPPPAYSENLADGSSATVQYAGCVEQQMFQQRYLHQHASEQGQAGAGGVTYQSQSSGVVHAQFDKNARFSRTTPPSIPPPPPGVQPTTAQLAAMNGGTVVMTQKKNSFF